MAQVAAVTTGDLSSAEAADRLGRYESERTATARRTPTWRLVVGQLRDPLILVLLSAAR